MRVGLLLRRNPTPNTRAESHGGNSAAIPVQSPADLYSNSTIALHIDTGKLAWYYQHLPGDDWDEDYPHERTLTRAAVRPDPKFVKWINPDVRRGETREIALVVGEGGGVFALDRLTGQFLWANPFPFDTPNFLIGNIDGKTGRVELNKNVMFTGPQDRKVICYWNTRSYWPTAFHPGLNALYVPVRENCLDMTSAGPTGNRRNGAWASRGQLRPQHLGGLMKIDASTGQMTPSTVPGPQQRRRPDHGRRRGVLGRRDQKFPRARRGVGQVLWDETLGGPIQNSTITYAVTEQYVAVYDGQRGTDCRHRGSAG